MKDMCLTYMSSIEKEQVKNSINIEEIKHTYDTFKKIVYDPYFQRETRLFLLGKYINI